MLPDGVEAITGAELTAEKEDDIESDFLGFFETFLLVFAGIALLVATFSIYNTFSILVAQRTRESALLRALGASRGQVARGRSRSRRSSSACWPRSAASSSGSAWPSGLLRRSWAPSA